jgi:hypothetical protein
MIISRIAAILNPVVTHEPTLSTECHDDDTRKVSFQRGTTCDIVLFEKTPVSYRIRQDIFSTSILLTKTIRLNRDIKSIVHMFRMRVMETK